MTDACESGYAVMGGDLSAGEIGALGRWNERWRYVFSDSANTAPRTRAFLERDPLFDISTVRSSVDGELPREVEVSENFPEVPLDCLRQGRWKCLWAAPYQKTEAMHVKEGRAVVACLRHLVRSPQKHGYQNFSPGRQSWFCFNSQ